MKKHFDKNLIMTEEKEKVKVKTCWICRKLIDDDDEKARDHCHITGNLEAQLIGV